MIPQTDLSIQRVSHRLRTPRMLAAMLIALANEEIVRAVALADRFGDPGYRQTIRRLRQQGWFVGSRHGVGYFLRTGDRELVHEAALIDEQDIVVRASSIRRAS